LIESKIDQESMNNYKVKIFNIFIINQLE